MPTCWVLTSFGVDVRPCKMPPGFDSLLVEVFFVHTPFDSAFVLAGYFSSTKCETGWTIPSPPVCSFPVFLRRSSLLPVRGSDRHSRKLDRETAVISYLSSGSGWTLLKLWSFFLSSIFLALFLWGEGVERHSVKFQPAQEQHGRTDALRQWPTCTASSAKNLPIFMTR